MITIFQFKRNWVWLFATVFIPSLLCACGNDEENASDPVFTEFKVSYTRCLTNQDRLTPSFSMTQTSQVYKIEKVDYYLNDNNIGQSTISPFSISYDLKSLPIGDYRFKAVAYLSGSGRYDDIDQTIEDVFHIYDKSKGYTGIDILPLSKSLRNGEILTAIINHIEPDLQGTSSRVSDCEWFWDDNVILTQEKQPFQLSYTISNQSVGEHKLSCTFYIAYSSEGGSGVSQVSFHPITINVTN